MAAAYLLSLGYRSIAYVAGTHRGLVWSQNRFTGAQQAVERSERCEIRLWSLEVDNIEQIQTGDTYANKIAPWITRLAGRSSDPIHQLSADACNQQPFKHQLAMYESGMEKQLLPLFKQILGWRACTAWLCQNDMVALMAVDFLRTSGIHVPADISVMGFDNLLESHNRRLSSYSFNPEAAIRRLLATVLGNPHYLLVRSGTPLAEPGYVVERDTTATARTVFSD